MNSVYVIVSHDMKYGSKEVLGVCDSLDEADSMIEESFTGFFDYKELKCKDSDEGREIIIQANSRNYKLVISQFTINQL